MFKIWWKITQKIDMKKFLTLFFTLFSINGYCEWTLITSSELGSQYIDFSTVKKSGNYLRVWDLINYKEKTSQISLMEYDCDEERTKILSLTSYTGPMGTGTSKSSPVTGKWDYVIPNTTGLYTLKKVCKR